MHDELKSLLRHEDYLRRRAIARAGNTADAEDLMQDLWLALLSAPPERVVSEKAFLSGMLRHLSVSGFRKDRARRLREQRAAQAEALPSAAEVAEKRALRQSLLSELLSLDEPYRRSLLLRHVSDMGAQEIADYLGIPAPTVRSHLHRGLAILRGRMGLEDEGRRRRAFALMLPFLHLPSRSRWAQPLLAAALIAALSTGLIIFAREERSAPDLGVRSSAELSSEPVQPHRTQESGDVFLAAGPDIETVAETPVLRGRIRLSWPEGSVEDLTLLIAAKAMLTGPEANFLGLMAEPRRPGQSQELSFQRVEQDGSYAITVPEAGQYQLHLKLAGQAEFAILNQATPELLDHQLILLGDLHWKAAREGLSFLGWAAEGESQDFGPEMNRDGPFLPGSSVCVLDRARDLLWETEIREERAQIAPPLADRMTAIRLVEKGGAVLVDAEVTLRCWGRDHRDWTLRLKTDSAGLLHLPRLNPLEERNQASLTIIHPRVGRFVVPGHEAVLPPIDLGAATVAIDGQLRKEFRIQDEDERPLADVVGVTLQSGVLKGWGRSSPEGLLTIDPLSLAEPRYFIPMDGPDGPLLWFTFPDPHEELILWHEQRGFLAIDDPSSAAIHWPLISAKSLRVIDADSSLGLSGAELRVVLKDRMASARMTPREPLLTDREGRVTLVPIQGAQFALLVEKRGYEGRTFGLDEIRDGEIALKPSRADLTEQRIRLIDERGRPLSDVRCGLSAINSNTEMRYATDQEGRLLFKGIAPDVDYRFRALAAGRELSLKEQPQFHPGAEERTFRCVPLEQQGVDFGRLSQDEALPVTLVLEDESGRFRALFGNEIHETILITREPQTITLYRPGLQTETISWSPEMGNLRFLRRPGFKVSGGLTGAIEGRSLSLQPVQLARKSRHSAPLGDALSSQSIELSLDGPMFESPALSPGIWSLRVMAAGKVLVEQLLTVESDLDLGTLAPE